jgi:penicillin-insensitive murein DD-endopeptidase
LSKISFLFLSFVLFSCSNHRTVSNFHHIDQVETIIASENTEVPVDSESESGKLPLIVGNPWDGYLLNGINTHKDFFPHHKNLVPASKEDYQYASLEMVDFLGSLGDFAEKELPGKKLLVGDIAAKNGGKLLRHQSHQNGAQVDISYIAKKIKKSGHRSHKESNSFPEKFVHRRKISPNFDLEANYKLFTYLINEKRRYIAVDKAIVWLLRSHNKKAKQIADSDLREFLIPVPHHHDHFHLSVDCYEFQDRCKREWTKWSRYGRSHKRYPKEYFFKEEDSQI